MFKSMLVAALAAVSMCTFAHAAQGQNDWRTKDWGAIDTAGKSQYDLRKAVVDQDEYLQGGDKYYFEAMLNRMTANNENALIDGLFDARRQAVIIRRNVIASMFPEESQYAMVSPDDSMRPMRMVIEAPKPHDVDYDTALDILTANLNATQSTQLCDWWATADERAKDVCVKMLKIDAERCSGPIYPSLYTHLTYDWVTPSK